MRAVGHDGVVDMLGGNENEVCLRRWVVGLGYGPNDAADNILH